MAHRSVLIIIESIDCRENSLRCRPYSGFFEKLSDCGILKAFPEVYFSSGKAHLPTSGGLARRTSSTLPFLNTVAIVATTGRTGTSSMLFMSVSMLNPLD